ncbi:reverse transcriptase domain-containing protein [Bradyrhizobium sp. BR 1433]|uniref:reverse transcriptase domain-containing protein n=1 Tax=Bradyrhizobium sp. BR 1433 TaxID=3447967 RepID=UPI003EE66FF6
MLTWQLKSPDLKRYPHFDSELSVQDATALATNPVAVASHKFYPFMLYNNRWTRFAKKGEFGDVKTRPIRYASRADAYIFSYYRHQLSMAYEAALSKYGLSDLITAYRRIQDADGKGKCNIHFARDAFDRISALGNCCVVALDISGFFESLDHQILKAAWCDLLGVNKLPEDHFRVFRAITRYAVVEKQDVYRRLGYFGSKHNPTTGSISNGYLVPYKNMPRRLCSGQEFRQKIGGGDGSKSLIDVNLKTYGIPQGSPVSDLLANVYLLKFDCAVRKRVSDLGGYYYRYSDDILIICPGDEATGAALAAEVREMIKHHGSKLLIKEKKSSVFEFKATASGQACRLTEGTQGENGLEYLGFKFDGKRIFIRDSTLSNLYRKVTRSARYAAIATTKRYPGKGIAFLEANFDYEQLIEKFGRVQDFGEFGDDFRNWTFWTYARRAAAIFGPRGSSIHRQLRKFRKNVRERAIEELKRAVGKV